MITQKLINKCIDVARGIDICDSIDRRTRHFAFILNKNKILAIGKNSQKTHPILQNNKYGYGSWSKLHAETSAVIKSGEVDHSNNKLLTFRFDKSNNINIGKPCKYCQRLLKDSNFKEVIYSTNNGKFLSL